MLKAQQESVRSLAAQAWPTVRAGVVYGTPNSSGMFMQLHLRQVRCLPTWV